MSKRDYYEILGVTRTATEVEIKSSYRKLAMKYHPDRNPGDKAAEDQFKQAAEAYAILADSDKRSAYDRFGHAGVGSAAGGGAGFDPTIFSEFGDFADILGNSIARRAMGRAQRLAPRQRPAACAAARARYGGKTDSWSSRRRVRSAAARDE